MMTDAARKPIAGPPGGRMELPRARARTRKAPSGRVRAVRVVVLFPVLIALFAVSLVAVYALPQQRVLRNLRTSATQLEAEKAYARPFLDDDAYMLDNYTDALMLDTAVVSRGTGPLTAAMQGAHASIASSQGPIAALTQSAAGRRAEASPYSYYWHGYQVVLRPLLMVFDLGRIRYLNLVALVLLALATTEGVRRAAGRKAATALALALLLCGFYIVPFSLQFSNMTYLMFAACLVVLALVERKRFEGVDLELFFLIGALAAFFDLLTTPLMTLGLPLALVLVSQAHDWTRRGAGWSAAYVARSTAVWAGGYVAAWAAKWALGSLVLGSNVFQSAYSQVLFRTGVTDGPTPEVALAKNITNLVPLVPAVTSGATPGQLAGLLAVGLFIAAAVGWAMTRRSAGDAVIKRAAPALLVVPLPYLWMIAANNHSMHHSWFTYRMQVFAVFAVVYFVATAIDFGHATRPPLRQERAG